MFAIIEDFIDQESGEHGEMCVYHNRDLSYITKAKTAFENIERAGITYSVAVVEPDEDFDCPLCGEGLENTPVGATPVGAAN